MAFDLSTVFCFYRCAVFQILIYQDMTSSAFYFYRIEAVERLVFVLQTSASANLLAQDNGERPGPCYSHLADHQTLEIEDGRAMDPSFEYWIALEPLVQKTAHSDLQSCIAPETSGDSFAAVVEAVCLCHSTLADISQKDELR